ncbi:UDP-N-acetylmuramoyl-L-alanyl-D-glutamate--2,6-diaminopimelate ligase [Blastococcus sp. TML/M2B]|uniref:UDP-N-acetylmuramoyl-L-alanyl-D-glutamate--2, 6-diaminopimelate ligase n=1 Tax=unclassified Blastococcus TaxID=2619396 RepID=UPI0019091228|nr:MULTISPECIES: UDP-N-acetylmuramoyl-L-alanyl-D-glutamate--2,6-diaminopimelate ligase [unclassified Blastococcus]MBN1092414.1 UDP-N-acetylmuramoyl-L-alanyl-D-glutamate--2,6-diaminopimelate ligase [Blastococcus sp. TML/M2B]MBN1097492.1 UDP-N-acetylmuramoyl-L-alanyl-D-glutamate--2,6-diaminopimelate ligase [Blastococcus sp. TML/C7B]
MTPTDGGSAPPPAGSRPRAPRPVPLPELADLLGRPVAGDPEVTVSGLTLASGDVRPGDLYAALPGARTHGVRYVAQAVERGAVAVLTDPTGRADAVATGLPVCVVEDPRGVLGEVADRVYDRPSERLQVIGITGTNGKTTTAYLVEAGLAAAGRATGLIGTVQTRTRTADGATTAIPSERTTPEAPAVHALLAAMAESGVATVVMEVSSHALVLGRVGAVRFAAAGFTNLGRDHLDFHGDLEEYFRAKALLFDGRAAAEVVDVDDEHGRRLLDRPGRPRPVTVSTEGADADWRATDVAAAPEGGSTFTLHGPGGLRRDARVRLPGRFNVANALLAVALLDAVGVPVDAALDGIAATVVPGRMEPVEAGQPFVAAVDYAHTPDAVSTALAALRTATTGRLITVLGCGGDRDTGKRAGMGAAAAAGSDVLVVTDDNPRSEDPAAIRAAMLAGVLEVPAHRRAEVHEVGDRRAAIATAVSLARPGDTVLVAGKGHETGQEVAGTVHPFDDRAVLREVLAEVRR